ncbi:[2Fe-2S] binding domain protein [Sulfobacillus acidophilus TPY]|nr:[2Fe-2S] binding domain protein [Sulfobacillus acidophilus TPY]
MLAVQANGHQIETVEGLEHDGRLHPLQQAFWDNHGLQCGFCTPGMLMTTTALLRRKLDVTEDEVRRAISGNLCRCTGYVNIVKAVLDARQRMKEEKAEV